MAENMFEIRQNDRRRQIIEENLDVADQILVTNPNMNILQSENEIGEPQEEVVIEQPEIKEEKPTEIEDSPVFKLSLLKKEKIKKNTFNYYLEDALDELAEILADKMGISKSEVVSLLLKSAILTNEDIQNLAKSDSKVEKLLEILKK